MTGRIFLVSLLSVLASAAKLTRLETTKTDAAPVNNDTSINSSNFTNITLVASHSGSPFHLSLIDANNLGFFIDENTTTWTPDGLTGTSGAEYKNLTVLQVFSSGNAQMLSANNGQTVYVPSTGNLSFTGPQTAVSPKTNAGPTSNAPSGNFSATDFHYTPPDDSDELGYFTSGGLGSNGWLACPLPGYENSNARWQIFANVTALGNADVPGNSVKNCSELEILGSVYTSTIPAAWEYTK